MTRCTEGVEMPGSTPCPRCDGTLTKISLTIDGRPVTMRSCSVCELRWWDADGELIDLTTVLDMAASSAGSARKNT